MISQAKVLTLIVFGLLFLNLSAQDDFENDPVAKLPNEDRTFRLGIQVNPNIAWMKSNRTGFESNGSKMGFAYGLSFEYFLSNNYLLSTGLFLQNTPGKVKYVGVTDGLDNLYVADVEATYKFRYIELPLTLKLRTNEIGYFTYYANIGLKAGINYKSKAEFEYNYSDGILPIQQSANYTLDDASDDANFMNMAMVIGAGVEYNISGNTSLILGLTFNNGFINQFDRTVSDVTDENILLLGGDLSNKEANANLNYMALNIGIYF